jgi:hypothetical protein
MIIGGRVYSSQHTSGRFSRPQPPPATEPKTVMGIEVEKTFTIHETEPFAGDVRLYELRIDDKLVWTGQGDDRADALLDAILAATGSDDELPDN